MDERLALWWVSFSVASCGFQSLKSSKTSGGRQNLLAQWKGKLSVPRRVHNTSPEGGSTALLCLSVGAYLLDGSVSSFRLASAGLWMCWSVCTQSIWETRSLLLPLKKHGVPLET